MCTIFATSRLILASRSARHIHLPCIAISRPLSKRGAQYMYVYVLYMYVEICTRKKRNLVRSILLRSLMSYTYCIWQLFRSHRLRKESAVAEEEDVAVLAMAAAKY